MNADLTVEENLRYLQTLEQVSVSRQELHRRLSEFQLDTYSSVPVRYLSKGQQRKASLLLSMFTRRRILLLDEPTEGLDDHALQTFEHWLRIAKHGRVVILSTHDLSFAKRISDQILVLDEHGIKSG